MVVQKGAGVWAGGQGRFQMMVKAAFPFEGGYEQGRGPLVA